MRAALGRGALPKEALDWGAAIALESQSAVLLDVILKVTTSDLQLHGGAPGCLPGGCKGSHGSLGLAGLPLKYPLHAPHEQSLQGLDRSQAEDHQEKVEG